MDDSLDHWSQDPAKFQHDHSALKIDMCIYSPVDFCVLAVYKHLSRMVLTWLPHCAHKAGTKT